MKMQAHQQLRVNAAPLTATAVLMATLALGAVAGYAIGTADRWSGVSPAAQPTVQRVVPQFPAATQPPVREPQNSYD
jgi:hypothetical protein